MVARTLVLSLSVAAMAASSGVAFAGSVASGEVTPGVIFGSGNTNGSFTMAQAGGVELGLRGKLRHDPNNGNNPSNIFNRVGSTSVYQFDPGQVPGQAAGTGQWSIEWSINSDFEDSTPDVQLDDLFYTLTFTSLDGMTNNSFDPINGVNPNTATVFWDHSLGNNTTTAATDVKATDATSYSTLIGSNNVAQNSWKALWVIPGYDPAAPGIYNVSLTAYDDANRTNAIASTAIQVQVVPTPTAMLAGMIGGLGLIARRRRNQSQNA